jgi:CotH protein
VAGKHWRTALSGMALALVAILTAVRVQTQTAPAVDPANTFFNDAVLHEIRLAINTADWKALQVHYLDNTYYTTDFKGDNITARNSAIRSRGTGSRSGVKPGLRVDFDRNVTNQTFMGLKSLILRNQTQDASNMHELLTMLFFRRMGLPASREAFTKLYINNVYEGLYTIVESVDKDFLSKHFGENDGHLYKYDYNADDKPYYYEYRDGNGDSYVPHPFKPETNESDPQSQTIADMIRTINQDGDNIFRTTIAPYVDLTTFVRHIAMEIFMGDNDGFDGNYGTNNFYWYRFENKTAFQWIAWDKSNTIMDGPTYPIFHNITDQPPERVNRLTLRVMGFPDLKNLFLDTLLEYADAFSDGTATPTPFPAGTLKPIVPAPTPTPAPAVDPDDPRGWAEREVERQYALIKDAVNADPTKPFSNVDFEKEVENVRNFVRQRSANVKAQVAAARPQ